MNFKDVNIKRYNIGNKENEGVGIYGERRVISSTPLHWHSHFEVEIILSGRALCTINGSCLEVCRGMAYILTPADFHTVETVEEGELLHLAFDESMVSDSRLYELTYGIGERCFCIREETLDMLLGTASMLISESRQEDGGCSRALCECFLTFLMRDVARATDHGKSELSPIQKALMYMETHFREDPSLSEVARIAGFTPGYFSELFRHATGESFSARLAKLKTRYAKMLLSQGFSVTDSCFRSGFGSTNNFLYTFKKLEGISPSEYKKRPAR